MTLNDMLLKITADIKAGKIDSNVELTHHGKEFDLDFNWQPDKNSAEVVLTIKL